MGDDGIIDPDPNNAMSALVAAAESIHNLFLSFTAAGFSEQQALYLVAQSLRPQNNG